MCGCGGGCCTTEPIRTPVDLTNQSDTIIGPEMIRNSRFCKDAKEGKFLKYLYEDSKTLYESMRRGARESNNGECLGWREGRGRPYVWLHYNEALLRAKNFGSGLVHYGLTPGAHVGIYSSNCPEWVLCEQGLFTFSMVSVPLYDSLGSEYIAYIVMQNEMSTVIVEDDGKINMLLDRSPPSLKKIIYIKDIRRDTIGKCKKAGIETYKFEEVERIGSANNHKYRDKPPLPEDICTICYNTGGSSGRPKGVMLTHENVVSCVSSVLLQMGEHRPMRKDVMISFLPLAHMLERISQVGMFMAGGAVGFYLGDIRNISDDMRALKPTVCPTVPKFLNRIHDRVMFDANSSFVKRNLMRIGLGRKLKDITKGVLSRNTIWDSIVFREVQEGMGGRLRLIVVGSAPLSASTLTFIRSALGCIVLEGYGQTECVGPATLTIQGDGKGEHVGPPLACCCIKLIDVPEMEYYASAGQGEICVKGSNVFKGYYKDSESTRESLDKDGWLCTGDIGAWQPNGTLKIIDRRKLTFKLSHGQYISPDRIESVLIKCRFVSQIFVHGEPLKSCLVAVVVPDVENIKDWAARHDISGTLSVLCVEDKVKELFLEELTKTAKAGRLKPFEHVKDIYLHPDAFSVQNGLLTPTFKAKRPQLKDYFKPQIEDMYSKLN